MSQEVDNFKTLPLGAVITAAGLSSRMGRLKALLPFGNGSMISSCVDNMRAAGAEIIVVVTGHRAGEIEAHLSDKGCEFVRNPDYASNQMFDSLSLGLHQLEGRCSAVLVSPVDVPCVREETIKALLQSDGAFTVPVYKGRRGHPVLMRGEIIPRILSHGGEGGLRGAIDALGISVREMECDDEGVSIDADCPEDYERILKLGEKR